MNRAAFFDAVRATLFFGTLTQAQVQGCEAILDACARYGVTDSHHVAHILAHVFHETGRYMLPIKETVMPSHKDKNPSDAEVIRRLDRAFAAGQLSWVRTPYWRNGWFGRGQLQITHLENYEKMGKRLGVDLVKNRDLALDRNISASIAVVGMAEGRFTGKKLSDYSFPAALDAGLDAKADPDGWRRHPRRIVNGRDGTDAQIAQYHRAFHAGVVAMGGVSKPAQPPKPAPAPSAPPSAPPPPTGSPVNPGAAIIAILIAAAVSVAVFIFGR